MRKRILEKEIKAVVEANIITEEKGREIIAFLSRAMEKRNNLLPVFISVLATVLVGLGIILILAHNWDALGKITKTFFAFLPLIIGQVVLAYSLIFKGGQRAWTESATVFLFFMLASCISLVSQIYHIPGEMSSFVLLWMVLTVPLVYICRSSIISLFYISGITVYAIIEGYEYERNQAFWSFALLLAIAPHYYRLIRENTSTNFLVLHHWFIAISLSLILGIFSRGNKSYMYVAYMCLFGLFYLVGQLNYFRKTFFGNSYKLLGVLGSLLLLFILSFEWFWKEEILDTVYLHITMESAISYMLLFLIILGYSIKNHWKNDDLLDPMKWTYLLFFTIFNLGIVSVNQFDNYWVPVILVNALLLFMGVYYIKKGADLNHFGVFNLGLLILIILIVSRFFDYAISYLTKGLVFVCLGLIFFVVNYWMFVRKKNATDER